MASKKTSKKKTTKSSGSRGSASQASGGKKAGKASGGTKKVTKRKPTASKATSKKRTSKKSTTKKSTTKKSTTKKVTTRQTAAKAAASTKKSTTKKAPTKKKPSKASSSASASDSGAGSNGEGVRPAVVAKPSPPRNWPPHRTAAAAAEVSHEPPTKAQLKKVKTGLSRKDLQHFKQELLIRRAEILEDTNSLNELRSMSDGDISRLPLHMADAGTDSWEKEFTLGLMESERQMLLEIDEALERIAEGTYGVCLEMGVPIDRARLDAKTWAKYCIEVARQRERQQPRRW